MSIYGYGEPVRVHYHQVQDGEEKHAHDGGDIDHQHEPWAGLYLGTLPRHLRARAPRVPVPPRPDLKEV